MAVKQFRSTTVVSVL
uniref:Uncharacterized protein n=1 Tax=Arundo donax TaxID=35708 RepID=A0A0A9EGS5_ARUDO